MENIKKAVKESIVQNFMEAAKFAPRGAEKQRPKSWSKGTKSGSDKRKMREQGKRESDPREVYEVWDRRTSDAYDAWLLPPNEPEPPHKYPEEAAQERKNISNAVYDWVSDTGLHSHFGHTKDEAEKLLKKYIENEYETPGDAASDLMSVYPAPKGVDPEQYKKHMEHGIHGYATATSPEHRDKMLIGNPYYDAINESYDTTSYFYNKLKENTEIPRHARETHEETPDYYGQLERQRKAGTSGEEPREEPNRPHTPESVAKLLQQAHKTALARTATAFGPGGKHAKQDPFYMIKHYADELDALHTRVMGDLT